MTDTLETAVACGLSLHPRRPGRAGDRRPTSPRRRAAPGVRPMIDRWFPLTYVLNNLNRGMGLQDAYPFVLSPPAIEKLRFVHDVIRVSAPGRPEPAGRSVLFRELGVVNAPEF